MKKSLSRILTLVLVLAMLVSVVPFALAAQTVESVTMSSTAASVDVGKTVTLTATVSLTGDLEEGGTALSTEVTWTSSDETIATVSGGVVTGVKAGDATITATSVADNTKSATCAVTVSNVAVTGVSITGGTVGVGGTFTPTVTIVPENATNKNYTLSIAGDSVTLSEDGKSVTGVKAGSAVVTVTTEDGEKTNTCVVEVVDKHVIEAEDLTMKVGEQKTLEPTIHFGDAAVTATPKATIKSGEDVIALNGLTVTAKKAGTAVVTLSYGTTTENTGTKDVTVTVSDSLIECDDASVANGGTVTLTATPKGLPTGYTDISYKWSATSGVTLFSESGNSVKAYGRTDGLSTVTVTVTYKLNGVTYETKKDVKVAVYSDHEVKVTVKSGITSFTFDDKDVFSAAKYDAQDMTASKPSMAQILATTDGEQLYLTTSTSGTVLGTLSRDDGNMKYGMSNVKFTLNGKSGTQYISYKIYNGTDKKLLVATGTIELTTGGSAGDIIYSTDYSTAVTFDEDDFVKFWNSYYTSATNTLKYVQFGVSSTVPAYGELYTTASAYTRKTVTKDMMFGSTALYEDLDTVTYVPSTKYTTPYTVEIPFTAYGGIGTANAATALSGTVVIELNNVSTTITSRGVVFGNGLSSLIAADYKEATKGVELAYVNFYLPDVEDGRLYYNYSGIMDSTRVSSKDKLYYYDSTVKTRPNADLDKVAFIPAAGTTGKVTLFYTGYDKDGKNPYEGKLVLTVTAKTKSAIFTDVTASYSWAADSVDFLNYEDVVNGTTSTTYSPANSITRGDFMLMLYRAFLEDDYKNFNVTSNFADVVKGTSDYSKETYQAVGVAKYLGIAKGDGTNYNPKAPISREEAMTLIYRTLEEVNLDLEYTSSKTTASFSDYSKVSSYAQSAIAYLIKHGVVIGSSGMINPKSNITRAEMAVILHRVLTY